MAQFEKINVLKIGDHIWHFTSPQIIEWKRDENSVTMRAVLRVQHEEHIAKREPDVADLAASSDISKE